VADIAELEQQLAEIEREAVEARSRAREEEVALAELDVQRRERVERLKLAERQALESRAELELKQQALEEARREELLGRVREASQRRELATRTAAAAIARVLGSLDDVEDSRANLAALLADAAELDLAPDVLEESPDLAAGMELLADRARTLTEKTLDNELAENAETTAAHDATVEDQVLPEHLREAARRRNSRGRHSFPGH
jgi:hypothetical protein